MDLLRRNIVLIQNTCMRMSTFVLNEHFTGDCYEVSYRYELLGAKTRKRNSRSIIGVPSTARCKQTIENSSFAVIQ